MLLVLMVLSSCRESRVVTMALAWDRAPLPLGFEYPEAPPVRLQHDKADCFHLVYQPSLLAHLDASGRNKVPVEFDLTSGVGGRRSGMAWFRIVSIDGIAFHVGPYSRYDEFMCLGSGLDPFREFYAP